MERELKRVFEQEDNQEYCQHGIALALCSEVHPRTHEAFGEGSVHRFGENLESDLEVWPQAKVVRYRSSSLAIALTNQEPPREVIESINGEGSVLFLNHSERHHTTLQVRSDGSGVVVFQPRTEDDRLNGDGSSRALQTPFVPVSVEPVEEVRENDNNPDLLVSDVRVDSGSIEGRLSRGESSLGRELAPNDPVGAASAEPNKEKQPTVRVTGNLPHHPVVTKSHHGHPVIRFSIAEHPEPGETVYHKAYATKGFAQKIIDQQLQKGDLVRVTGVEQTHPKVKNGKPVTQEGGEIVTEKVIYAYGAKKVRKEEGERQN